MRVLERLQPDQVNPEVYAGIKYNAVRVPKTRDLDRKKAEQLIKCAAEAYNYGWGGGVYNTNSSFGNFSYRDGESIITSPTNKNLGKLVPEDLVRVVGWDKTTSPSTAYYEGNREPTSEVLAHLEINETRPKNNVIVHGHDRLSTQMGPALSEYYPRLVSITKKPEPYGTIELARNLADLLKENNQYLIAKSHGFFSLGKNFDEALDSARSMHKAAIMLKIYGKDKRLLSVLDKLNWLDRASLFLSDTIGSQVIRLKSGIRGKMDFLAYE